MISVTLAVLQQSSVHVHTTAKPISQESLTLSTVDPGKMRTSNFFMFVFCYCKYSSSLNDVVSS